MVRLRAYSMAAPVGDGFPTPEAPTHVSMRGSWAHNCIRSSGTSEKTKQRSLKQLAGTPASSAAAWKVEVRAGALGATLDHEVPRSLEVARRGWQGRK